MREWDLKPSFSPNRPLATLFKAEYTDEEVVKYFLRSHTKEEVLIGFFEFVRQYFENIAFFIVWPGSIKLLKKIGENIAEGEYVINLYNAEFLNGVILSKGPHKRNVPHDEQTLLELRQFLKEIPDNIWMYPMKVGAKIDFLVYADTPLGFENECVSKFEFVFKKTLLAFRLLLIKRELEQV